MKKIIALLLALVMLMGLCVPAMATDGNVTNDEAVLRLIVPENWELSLKQWGFVPVRTETALLPIQSSMLITLNPTMRK